MTIAAGAIAIIAIAAAARAQSAAPTACGGISAAERRASTEPILAAVAMMHGLDPVLLDAIAKVESDRCSDAVSSKGAAGLMQLMPGTADRFGVADVFDPVQNALGAARFLDYLKRIHAEGRLTLPEIIAAYNAGEAAVDKAGGIPHYQETQDYVRRVLWLYFTGYVPSSARINSQDSEVPHHTSAAKIAPRPRKAAIARDPDVAALEQLSELRRERALEQSAR